ncbi:MAG: bifunctional 4-hydroxy-2-oxoglutarate aldolase/2-dehydro-3-deoxy-phosphogluconate aldolase [Calditrichaeota bacterium]|nr:MAG: bifunctional 4-hydroxy-2-oxoglutarate aldolase/2-dehydro-3-deoxy-phosphogluconate aldolase [Calditrichota bacterium]
MKRQTYFTNIVERLETYRLIPVVVLNHAQKAGALAQALLNGGLPCAEITFRTEAAEKAIQIIAHDFPDMLVGAGTVISPVQAERAAKAGAKFIVSPGFSTAVADYCRSTHLPYFPGISTATEIQMAMEKDLKILKFFPAEAAGGVKYLKALSGPFPAIQFIPTGGINAQNLAAYLDLGCVLSCGGSWMVPKQLIESGDFSTITQITQQAIEIVKQKSV